MEDPKKLRFLERFQRLLRMGTDGVVNCTKISVYVILPVSSPEGMFRSRRGKPNQTNTDMLKKVIALTLITGTLVGIAHAAGFKCTFCNGTGFQGNVNCFPCKGSGRNSGY
jgi:DnaJ-class molecular chaperone